MKQVKISPDSELEACIVETREFNYFDYIIFNHFYFLELPWSLTIFHSKGNKEFLKKKLHFLDNIKWIEIPNEINNINDYNNLMWNSWFWEQLKGKRILIFQTDSLLCKKGIEQFLNYDYAGAPWKQGKWIYHPVYGKTSVGNGGLSIRNRELCLYITKNIKERFENEDGFFSILCNYFGKVPPFELAMKFSSETIMDFDSIAIHNIWEHHSDEICLKKLNLIKY